MVYRHVQDQVTCRTLRIADRLQITAIVALLIYSSKHASPEYPDVSEWTACSKPLGLWNSVWAVKVGFDCVIVFWGHRRLQASRATNTCVFFQPILTMVPSDIFLVSGMWRLDPYRLRSRILTHLELHGPTRCFPLGAWARRQIGSLGTTPATTQTSLIPHYTLGS